MCGEVKSKDKDKTASTPLVTVSDLQRLSKFEIIILKMRKMPFKTKFKPDFDINWGRKYEKATYPIRSKKEVKLFEIREFVKAKKKEKMAEILADNNDDDILGSNMFSSMIPPVMPSVSDSFNVDDLVKRIDAKIAELEAEEQRENCG